MQLIVIREIEDANAVRLFMIVLLYLSIRTVTLIYSSVGSR